MGINRDSILFEKIAKNYWEYYRELEDEFILTRRYVDINEKNFSTFSIEYLKLYQAVCSEIDVVGKAMAQVLDSSFKAEDKKNNILKWWYLIQNNYKVTEGPYTYINKTAEPIRVRMDSFRCNLLGNYEVIPWNCFVSEMRKDKKGKTYYAVANKCKVPFWWSSYNAVKHNRISIGDDTENYDKANLKNLSYAFGALYILERAFMDSIGLYDDLQSFMNFSKLFQTKRRLTIKEMDELYKSK